GRQVVVQVVEDGSRDRDRRQRAVFERLQPEARGGLGAALISLRGFQGRTTAYEGRQHESPRALRVHGPILLGKGIGGSTFRRKGVNRQASDQAPYGVCTQTH